jgi:uncharacterized protein (DUF1501 family)
MAVAVPPLFPSLVSPCKGLQLYRVFAAPLGYPAAFCCSARLSVPSTRRRVMREDEETVSGRCAPGGASSARARPTKHPLGSSRNPPEAHHLVRSCPSPHAVTSGSASAVGASPGGDNNGPAIFVGVTAKARRAERWGAERIQVACTDAGQNKGIV